MTKNGHVTCKLSPQSEGTLLISMALILIAGLVATTRLIRERVAPASNWSRFIFMYMMVRSGCSGILRYST